VFSSPSFPPMCPCAHLHPCYTSCIGRPIQECLGFSRTFFGGRPFNSSSRRFVGLLLPRPADDLFVAFVPWTTRSSPTTFPTDALFFSVFKKTESFLSPGGRSDIFFHPPPPFQFFLLSEMEISSFFFLWSPVCFIFDF